MKIAGLSHAQAVMLLHKHLTGDISGDWRTVCVLLRKGLLAKDGKNLVVTAWGKLWCDRNHLNVA